MQRIELNKNFDAFVKATAKSNLSGDYRKLACGIAEFRKTEIILSLNAVDMGAVLSKALECPRLYENEKKMLTAAISHYQVISSNLDPWPMIEEDDLKTPQAIHAYLKEVNKILEKDSNKFIERMQSCCWLILNLDRIADITDDKSENIKFTSEEKTTIAMCAASPFQRLPRLGLFAADWIRIGKDINDKALEETISSLNLKFKVLATIANQTKKASEMEQATLQANQGYFLSAYNALLGYKVSSEFDLTMNILKPAISSALKAKLEGSENLPGQAPQEAEAPQNLAALQESLNLTEDKLADNTSMKELEESVRIIEDRFNVGMDSLAQEQERKIQELEKDNLALSRKFTQIADDLDSRKAEIKEFQKENANLKEKNKELFAKIEAVVQSSSDLAGAVEENNAVILKLKAEISGLSQNNQDQNEKHRADIQELEKSIEDQQVLIAKLEAEKEALNAQHRQLLELKQREFEVAQAAHQAQLDAANQAFAAERAEKNRFFNSLGQAQARNQQLQGTLDQLQRESDLAVRFNRISVGQALVAQQESPFEILQNNVDRFKDSDPNLSIALQKLYFHLQNDLSKHPDSDKPLRICMLTNTMLDTASKQAFLDDSPKNQAAVFKGYEKDCSQVDGRQSTLRIIAAVAIAIAITVAVTIALVGICALFGTLIGGPVGAALGGAAGLVKGIATGAGIGITVAASVTGVTLGGVSAHSFLKDSTGIKLAKDVSKEVKNKPQPL